MATHPRGCREGQVRDCSSGPRHGPRTQRGLSHFSQLFHCRVLLGNSDGEIEKSLKKRSFELSPEAGVRFQGMCLGPDPFTELIQLQNGDDDTQLLPPSGEMVLLKLSQEDYTTQLKGTIIIQLEKCLHRTSELISAKYSSAYAVFN